MYANYNQVKLWSAKSQLPMYFISLLKYLAVFLIPRYVHPRTEELVGKCCLFRENQQYLNPLTCGLVLEVLRLVWLRRIEPATEVDATLPPCHVLPHKWRHPGNSGIDVTD